MLRKMIKFKEEDIITCRNWQTICDAIYCPVDGYTELPESGVIWCTLDDILLLFDAIKQYPNGKYIIVSSYSDFGLVYQKDDSPTDDLIRTVKLACHTLNNVGYTGITIPPVCDIKRCYPVDKYSAKCYRYTPFTFNFIPHQIKYWYSVNNSINNDSHIRTIPFGVQAYKEKFFENIKFPGIGKKRDEIYVNWSDNTLERILLKEKLKKEKHVVIDNENLEYEDFLNRLAEFKYILCPPGNGLDSYRILEAIYCGCWPIIEQNKLDLNLPMLSYWPGQIDDIIRKIKPSPCIFMAANASNHTKILLENARLSTWNKRIQNLKKSLM